MEGQAVVEALGNQLLEILDGFGSNVGTEADDDITVILDRHLDIFGGFLGLGEVGGLVAVDGGVDLGHQGRFGDGNEFRDLLRRAFFSAHGDDEDRNHGGDGDCHGDENDDECQRTFADALFSGRFFLLGHDGVPFLIS